jgi:hypothetical protein
MVMDRQPFFSLELSPEGGDKFRNVLQSRPRSEGWYIEDEKQRMKKNVLK